MSQFIECEACHNVLSDQATFCPKCGHPVAKAQAPLPQVSGQLRPKVDTSQKIALASLVIGAITCLGLKFYFGLPWAGPIIVGLIVMGTGYTTLLRISADESVVDSKTINRR